jgi:hypothetical protein
MDRNQMERIMIAAGLAASLFLMQVAHVHGQSIQTHPPAVGTR